MRATKTYPINKSPLFRIRSISKLCKVLRIPRKDLRHYQQWSENYNVFSIRENNKEREVQEPKPMLKRLHKLIFIFLSRIQPPDYLYSGRRHISSIMNAAVHKDAGYLHKEDIRKYFPSCKMEFAFRFFRRRMFMSEDVAWELAKVICYKDCFPTGSPLSQSIAYWAYADAFDEIDARSKRANIAFSLWVDDMVFSNQEPIPKLFIVGVCGVIKRYMLQTKKEKRKEYGKKDHKLVTGAIITPNNSLTVPNRHMHKLHKFKEANRDLRVFLDPKRYHEFRSIMGTLRYCRSIQPGFWSGYYRALVPIEKEILAAEKVRKSAKKGGRPNLMNPKPLGSHTMDIPPLDPHEN